MSLPAATIQSETDGGVAGEHITLPVVPAFVAPTIFGKDHNTIKTSLVPFACWRANDVRFDFESSFVRPEINAEVGLLKSLIDRHTLPNSRGDPIHKPVLTVFGHADPTGNDDFNKSLSGRRAQAIYALLTRDVDLWEDLFSHPLGNDRWDANALNTMQVALGRLPEQKPIGGAARKTLFKEYMDLVCTIRDVAGEPIKEQDGTIRRLHLDRRDFLSAGVDPGGKGDFQGCGEFNPLLVFSSEESRRFSKPEFKDQRDRENLPNRRVVIFLFRPGVHVRPENWPCPRAKEGVSACRKRLWSDSKVRLSNQESRRKYEDTLDTFACRFYDRLNFKSPCEKVVPTPSDVCFIFLKLFDDSFQEVLKEKKYQIKGVERGKKLDGSTDNDGLLRHEFLPDDHYEITCEGHTEVVEPFYMAEMALNNEPWFMRMRGLTLPKS